MVYKIQASKKYNMYPLQNKLKNLLKYLMWNANENHLRNEQEVWVAKASRSIDSKFAKADAIPMHHCNYYSQFQLL